MLFRSTFSDITSPSSIFYTTTKWTKRITNITEDGDNITFDFHERLLDIPVADEATFITEDQFVANWNKVEDAESYTLYVNKYMGGDFIINESFDKFSAGSVSMPTSIDIADELDSYMNLAGWTGKFIYQAGGMIKIGDRNDSGSLISPLIDLSGVDGICNVSFSVRNRSNLSDMTVIVSQDKELSNVIFSETISVNNTLTDYSYNINNGVKECYFAILTTTSLIYVDDLKIVSGPDDKDLINDEKYIFAGITAKIGRAHV